jgi:hypothetical protein
MPASDRVQLHVALPYKKEPGHDPKVSRYLSMGYRVEELQRLTDRDALVTLVREAEPRAPLA